MVVVAAAAAAAVAVAVCAVGFRVMLLAVAAAATMSVVMMAVGRVVAMVAGLLQLVAFADGRGCQGFPFYTQAILTNHTLGKSNSLDFRGGHPSI